MTRYLVLGGNGFIGRHLVRQLIEQGVTPLVADLSPNPAAPFIRVDYTNAATLQSVLRGIDVVMHLAWTTTPQSGTDDPTGDVTENILGSLNLFRACVAQGVKRLVFCSSGGAVYGHAQSNLITEAHPLEPLSSYGITKLAVENYLRLFSRLYGIEYVIMRPANAYGEGQIGGKDQGVIAACMNALLYHQKFTVWGDGTVIRDYVHVDDIAGAISAAANAGAANRVFNIGSGQGLSINQLIGLIEKITGRVVEVDYAAERQIDARVNVLDSSLAKAALGWTPAISINEGLQRQWEFLLSGQSRAKHSVANVRPAQAHS
jgi:UDP-glucose 4-epimerase